MSLKGGRRETIHFTYKIEWLTRLRQFFLRTFSPTAPADLVRRPQRRPGADRCPRPQTAPRPCLFHTGGVGSLRRCPVLGSGRHVPPAAPGRSGPLYLLRLPGSRSGKTGARLADRPHPRHIDARLTVTRLRHRHGPSAGGKAVRPYDSFRRLYDRLGMLDERTGHLEDQ